MLARYERSAPTLAEVDRTNVRGYTVLGGGAYPFQWVERHRREIYPSPEQVTRWVTIYHAEHR
jgi:hypothetical protein